MRYVTTESSLIKYQRLVLHNLALSLHEVYTYKATGPDHSDDQTTCLELTGSSPDHVQPPARPSTVVLTAWPHLGQLLFASIAGWLAGAAPRQAAAVAEFSVH